MKVVRVRVLGTKWDCCIGGLMGEGSVNKFFRTVFTEELAEADAEDEDDDGEDDEEDEEEDEGDDEEESEAAGGWIGRVRWLDNGDLERSRLSLFGLLSALSLSVGIGSLLSLLVLSLF